MTESRLLINVKKNMLKTVDIYRHILGPWIFFKNLFFLFLLENSINENIPHSSWFSGEAEQKQIF